MRFGGAASVSSRLQIPLFEFLRRRAEVAEVGNGRAGWREREGLKRFGEQLVQILSAGEGGGDVRIVILAGMLRHEVRNVGDQLQDDVWIVAGDARRGASGG